MNIRAILFSGLKKIKSEAFDKLKETFSAENFSKILPIKEISNDKIKKAFYIGCGISIVLNIVLITSIISTSNNYSDSKLLVSTLRGQLDSAKTELDGSLKTVGTLTSTVEELTERNKELNITLTESKVFLSQLQEITGQLGVENTTASEAIRSSLDSTDKLTGYNRSIEAYNSKLGSGIERSIRLVDTITGDLNNLTGISGQGPETNKIFNLKEQATYWWISLVFYCILYCWYLVGKTTSKIITYKEEKK